MHESRKVETMTNTIWGGRFAASPADIMVEINSSVGFDRRLYLHDIKASIAHARMLADCAIISETDAAEIIRGLNQVQSEIDNGSFTFSRTLEDVHMNIESRLREIVGEPAGRLHTARSRNDQVAVDFRLYVRDGVDQIDGLLLGLQRALARKALAHAKTIMPGFTHLQPAQPVTFGHHCLAYVEMLARDRSRFADARRRMNESPLGAVALAGTSFPIDRDATAKALGFAGPMRNSLDAVSDRDFAVEALSAAALCAIHLSRLAEEIVLWCAPQFGFIRLSDKFTTGSSIMPQKRNPDAAELVRAKAGRILGHLTSLLMVMKGLPLAYSKDMQEDKEPVFDGLDTLSLSIAAMTGMVEDLEPDRDAMRKAAASGFATATDLADWLVRKLNLPFREAHHVVGKLVALAESRDRDLRDLGLAEMRKVHPGIDEEALAVLSVESSVASRRSLAGTAPENVEREARRWLEALAADAPGSDR
jgi:argininosuccinate lyase